MGFFKWAMKHGPGNVGSLAKAQAKVYNQFKKQYPQLSQDELLRRTLKVRLAAGAMLGDAALSEAEQEEMIKEAKGSLAKLTMQIAIYENPDVVDLPQKTFNEMFDVIEEVIAKYADEEPSVRPENTEEQFHEAQQPGEGEPVDKGPPLGDDNRVGIWLRLFAYTIDFSILLFGSSFFIWYIYYAIHPDTKVLLAYILLIFPGIVFYFTYLQSHGRQTLGEKFLGIKVYSLTGKAITKRRAILRFLCCLIPLYEFITIITLLGDKYSLADKIVSTKLLQVKKVGIIRFALPIALLVMWTLGETSIHTPQAKKYVYKGGALTLSPPEHVSSQPKAKPPPKVSAGGTLSTTDIAYKYGSAVVAIETYDYNAQLIGTGTGFVADSHGLIVTNHHVVSNANRILIRFPNQKEFDAKILSSDKSWDITILKINETNLQSIPLGEINQIRVGHKIVVIGNPLGINNTVTEGTVSAVRTSAANTQKVLQISAPVSRGSSGSPVIDTSGKCVGMVTFIVESGQNINFAIPIDYIKNLLNGVEEYIGSPPAAVAGKLPGAPVESKLQQENILETTESKKNKYREGKIAETTRSIENIKKKLAEKYQQQRNYEEGRGVSKGSEPVKNPDGSITSTTPWRDGPKTIDTRIGSNTEVVRPDPQVYGKVYALINSKVFHRPECSVVLGKKDLMTFNSRAEALKYRAEPCLLCNP